jgi:hypothetical protein
MHIQLVWCEDQFGLYSAHCGDDAVRSFIVGSDARVGQAKVAACRHTELVRGGDCFAVTIFNLAARTHLAARAVYKSDSEAFLLHEEQCAATCDFYIVRVWAKCQHITLWQV